MLSQLQELTQTADGRFATAAELEFLKTYLEAAATRKQVYTTLRDQAPKIVNEVIQTKRANQPQAFQTAGRDTTDFCQRDLGMMLKLTASAILFGDLDRFRSNVLVWYRTITTAFGYQSQTAHTYKLLHKVVDQHLEPEARKVAGFALQLNPSILG